MNPSRRSDSLFLTDIREAIAKILAYTAGGREAFLADGRTQLDVIWDVIQNDLPSLKLQMDSLRAQD